MELRKVSQLLYQVKIVNQELTSKFEKETGFSLTRFELLMILKEQGQCTQAELQAALNIDSAAVTRHLKILEEKAYVVRERNPLNQREIVVSVTAAAQTALATCQKEHQTLESSINLGLTEEEVEQLLVILNKLYRESGN